MASKRSSRRSSRSSRPRVYEVTAGGSTLYKGSSLREAQDRFDEAIHWNYEDMRYVDEEIELRHNRRLVRSFGPGGFRPRYFHPDPKWADQGSGRGRHGNMRSVDRLKEQAKSYAKLRGHMLGHFASGGRW